MTDAQYWAIANALPKTTAQGTIILDWHSQLPNCPPDPMSCSWVRGYNPVNNCWIDPGAQFSTPPSPYPSPSSWGVSVCNAPVSTTPPPSGGGSTAPPPTTSTLPPSGSGSGGSGTPIVSSNPGFSFSTIPTWVYFAFAGFAIFMFVKN